MEAIDTIKLSTSQSGEAALNESVYLDNNLGLMSFTDVDAWTSKTADVNAENVMVLNRGDFWSRGDNWRQVLQKIHGKDWPHEIFNYYLSDLAGKEFPAPEALGELKFSQYGSSIYECTNGNHRVVAGKCWLLSKYPDNATFKNVNIICYPVYDELKPLISELVSSNTDCFVAHIPADYRNSRNSKGEMIQCYFMPNDGSFKVYSWSGKTLTLTRHSMLTLDKWLLNRGIGPFFQSWVLCPASVLSRLIA